MAQTTLGGREVNKIRLKLEWHDDQEPVGYEIDYSIDDVRERILLQVLQQSLPLALRRLREEVVKKIDREEDQ